MESLWQHHPDLPEFPNLPGDIRTDVLVIGGGMAGLLTAYCLRRRGIDAVVAEQGRICGGTTGGTTGKITAQHGLIYQKILASSGEDHAKQYLAANERAVEQLKDLCIQSGCPLEVKDNYVYSTDPRKLERELDALQKIGAKALYHAHPPLPVYAAGAVGFPRQGQFHPLKLAASLAKDLCVFEHTRVRELIGTEAVTDYGRIRAEKVVVATHFPFLNKHGSYFLKLYQHRSYLLALENVPPLQAMYVDDCGEGFTFSSFGNDFLLGGGGHRTGKQGSCWDALRQLQARHFPGARERFHWGAQDTMSLDGIPYIGHYSRNTPDLYVAAGFNKWGMTGSMVSANLLSAMIAGEEPEEAPVFSPSRSILNPQLLINGFETAKNLLTPTTRRCPHLGCALKYNPQERSWDCACHGSRFSQSGKVLDNPATDDWNPGPKDLPR